MANPTLPAPKKSHVLLPHIFDDAIRVHVIGCGGTGSIVVPGLVKIHRTMLALGHPGGLDVTVWDSDAVSESNTVRQNFFESDIGANKADIMVTRLNVAHSAIGLDWSARNERFTDAQYSRTGGADLFIGCVDTKASRREILAAIQGERRSCYWLDCGNKEDFGQVIAGEWRGGGHKQLEQPRLPLVTELLPEIIAGDEEDDTPSCSAVQSIMRQGVITNQMCATWALAWLSEALRFGQIGWNGVFFNLAQGRVTSIPVDPGKWATMGYAPQQASTPHQGGNTTAQY